MIFRQGYRIVYKTYKGHRKILGGLIICFDRKIIGFCEELLLMYVGVFSEKLV